MINNFCEKAQRYIAVAESIAFDFGHTSVGSEHLLLSFLKIKDSKIKKILETQNINYETIKKDLLLVFEKKDSLPFYMEYTPSFKEILEKASLQSQKYNEEKVSVESLALALFREEDSLAHELLTKYNFDFKLIEDNIQLSKISFLDNIEELTNLNKMSFKKPTIVFEREKEINLVVGTLLRKQKPNALIVGEPGVGKSAIVEYLAYKIVRGEVGEELSDKVIYELDIPSIVAGTKYRGEFEDKLKKIVKKIKEDSSAIIFIDEIHNIVGAGGAEGAIDASNILKPYLARGEIKCIGATTYDEYIKLIEKEKAIERRFQLIKIDEPDIDKSYRIIKGIKKEYEDFHKVKINDEICKKIVMLSKKYISDRYFPDKAIDVLDCSCVEAKKRQVKQLSEDIVIETIENLHNVEINKCIIKQSLVNELEKKIIGQRNAVEKVANYLSYIEKGIIEENKPLGIFLFIGPSGVGKTELAKQIAKNCFGHSDSYIKIDMAEFKEPHSISKLIGTPPGYIGHESQTLIVDRIRNHPHSVVILDEIEKAHKDVLNIFLNVFDEGYFYDSKKRKINFSNALIIMTSNLGRKEPQNKVGFVEQTFSEEEVIKETKKYFSDEFVNRIDEIVSFKELDEDSMVKIVKEYVNEYQNKCDFEINSEDFIENILKNEESKKYGVRFIKREVKKNIIKTLENKVKVF